MSDNDCALCHKSGELEERNILTKNAIQTIFRFCKVSYQSCTLFEDDSFAGYLTGQRIGMSVQNNLKVYGYFCSAKKVASLFDYENVYGIIGLGRPDGDFKYQQNTLEEMVSAYSLNTKSILIYFGLEGRLMFGMSPEYKDMQMAEFPIVDTTLHTLDFTRIDIYNRNSDESSTILGDLRYVMNLNQIMSTTSGEVLKVIIKHLTDSIVKSGLKDTIKKVTDEELIVLVNKAEQIQSIARIKITTAQGRFLHLADLFVATEDSENCGKTSCKYRLMFERSAGPLFTLGTSFLHHRLVELKPDKFLISTGTLNSTEVSSLTYNDISSTPQLAYLALMMAISLIVLFKSCEGCATTLNNIR